jgi:hypothetical protein
MLVNNDSKTSQICNYYFIVIFESPIDEIFNLMNIKNEVPYLILFLL